MIKAEIRLEKQIAAFLPEALEQVIAAYKKYAEVKEGAKEFKEAQGACKVALGHMALLTKLHEQVKESGAMGTHTQHLESLMVRARAELDGTEAG